MSSAVPFYCEKAPDISPEPDFASGAADARLIAARGVTFPQAR
jgi:hypothetical protein